MNVSLSVQNIVWCSGKGDGEHRSDEQPTNEHISLLPNIGNEDFKPSSYPVSSPVRNNLSYPSFQAMSE